ncbi:hypothetical protein Nos7524_1980 [Nostoc sp. PCC 7524]|uniref:hypothetical protein n=1 Tax=Nostoc sp. (strain ATCC 29411 / PCC 7524) TaxID=28072 RepID=UPI00029ED37E|nr:hypothetical protein [Nostoc sp. PCC 7524]AFY47838.1 hypothetical protein Nos7524_1980 [Nostoc sp. PCC 7524]
MLKKSCYLWFRLIRKTYPWLSLVIQARRVIFASGVERMREQVQFWMLFYKLDFANLLAIAIDLIQPEFWV